VIWLDFEAAEGLSDVSQLAPEFKKVLRALFNLEAAHYLDFDATLLPAAGEEPALYRLAIFFAVDFWDVLTSRNEYVTNLEGLEAEIDLTGSLQSLIDKEGAAAGGVMVKGATVSLGIDRKVLSTKALESMPEGARNSIDSILNTLPDEVAAKAPHLASLLTALSQPSLPRTEPRQRSVLGRRRYSHPPRRLGRSRALPTTCLSTASISVSALAPMPRRSCTSLRRVLRPCCWRLPTLCLSLC